MPDNPLFYVIAAAIAVVLGVVCFFLGSAYRRKADSTTIGSAEDEARKILSDNEKIVMNIGFDEEPKKEDKAWNAFDYMDEEKESENDEG